MLAGPAFAIPANLRKEIDLAKYLLKRLLLAVLVMFVVIFVAFSSSAWYLATRWKT